MKDAIKTSLHKKKDGVFKTSEEMLSSRDKLIEEYLKKGGEVTKIKYNPPE